jgi:hypothetical protein
MTTISNSKIDTAHSHQSENQSNTFQLAQTSNTAPGSIYPVLNNATREQALNYFKAFSSAEDPIAVGAYLLPNGNLALYGRWPEDFRSNNSSASNTHSDALEDIQNSAAEAKKRGILPEEAEFSELTVELYDIIDIPGFLEH